MTLVSELPLGPLPGEALSFFQMFLVAKQDNALTEMHLLHP